MPEPLATIVTHETILRRHRELVARHWDYSQRGKTPGRPPVAPEIVDLVLRMARESPLRAKFRARSVISAKPSRLQPLPMSSKPTALSRHRIGDSGRRGGVSSKPTGMLLSSVDFTTIEAWTKRGSLSTTCCLLWNWHRNGCTSPAAPRIPMSRGCCRSQGI
jgi:hypothetical protein